MMKRTEQEYDWMAGVFKPKHVKSGLSPFFLRKPYAGTSAETKDNAQEELHEYDYLK